MTTQLLGNAKGKGCRRSLGLESWTFDGATKLAAPKSESKFETTLFRGVFGPPRFRCPRTAALHIYVRPRQDDQCPLACYVPPRKRVAVRMDCRFGRVHEESTMYRRFRRQWSSCRSHWVANVDQRAPHHGMGGGMSLVVFSFAPSVRIRTCGFAGIEECLLFAFPSIGARMPAQAHYLFTHPLPLTYCNEYHGQDARR